MSAAEQAGERRAVNASPSGNAPRVSVLTTIYNAGPYLSGSLDSLLRQSFGDWELIAVENGSRDDSAALLASYHDQRIRAFFLPSNIGRTPALRYAFAQARGEYIAVLDADDIAQPERLRRQVEHLDGRPEVVLLGTWADYIDADNRVIGAWTPPTEAAALLNSMASENPIVHSSAMYRTAIAREVGGYPEDRPYSQDHGLWLKLLAVGAPGMVPEHLTQFRILPSSMTRSRRHEVDVAHDLLRAWIDAGHELKLSDEGRRRNREEVAIARVRYAAALARSRRLSEGVRSAWRALVADPISLVNNRITRGLFWR
jgi:glycosyltransferase involved in cell wall biosynthesis